MDELTLKQKRMFLYFIEATHKIIDRDGFENVTLRKISKEAGYNSATLYNDYQDLDHLLQFACVEYLIEYQKKLMKKLKGMTDPKEIYFVAWDMFASECYDHPQVFYHLFFSKHKNQVHQTFYRYLEIFDIEYSFSPREKIFSFITLPDLGKRHTILVESLAEKGLIENRDTSAKANMLVLAFESMLNALRKDRESRTREEFVTEITRYAKILLRLE